MRTHKVDIYAERREVCPRRQMGKTAIGNALLDGMSLVLACPRQLSCPRSDDAGGKGPCMAPGPGRARRPDRAAIALRHPCPDPMRSGANPAAPGGQWSPGFGIGQRNAIGWRADSHGNIGLLADRQAPSGGGHCRFKRCLCRCVGALYRRQRLCCLCR